MDQRPFSGKWYWKKPLTEEELWSSFSSFIFCLHLYLSFRVYYIQYISFLSVNKSVRKILCVLFCNLIVFEISGSNGIPLVPENISHIFSPKWSLVKRFTFKYKEKKHKK